MLGADVNGSPKTMDCQFVVCYGRNLGPAQIVLLIVALLLALPLTAQPSIELYAQLPELHNPKLSPDGEHFAVEMSYKGSRVLVVRDIYGGKPPAIVQPGDVKLHDFEWVSNDRLILHVRATGQLSNGRLFDYTRLLSVDKDGSDVVQFEMRPNEDSLYADYPYIVSRLPDDPDHVLAVLNDEYGRFGFPEVERVNIYTGQGKLAQRNVRDVLEWVADPKGQLRIGIAAANKGRGHRASQATIYHRVSEDDEWEVVYEAGILTGRMMHPVGFDPNDDMVLLVSSDELEGNNLMEDSPAIHRLDLRTGELIGEYKDERALAVEAMVKELFGIARASVTSRSDDDQRMIVTTYSDVIPHEYYLYERDENRISPLGGTYPGLKDAVFAPMLSVEYEARDGRAIPGFLTIPPDLKGKPPLVVYPHGGPWARDHWEFDNYVQFLASRGYAVFQPQFRGSTGLGVEHLEAGYGEWGMAIQDDITDGVKWLIAEGKVDPDRICIYGVSFGGYAAAMGAAKTPKLYRCAITENGVLDLKRFIKSADIYVFADANRAMWNDGDSIEVASPYHLYKQIEIPMLVIASDKDTVVPWADHSKRFYKRLKKLDIESDLLVLEGGEHWRTNEAHEVQKMQTIISFLNRHIGTSESVSSGKSD